MPPVFVYFDLKTTVGLNNVSTTFDALQFEKSSKIAKNWEAVEIVHIGMKKPHIHWIKRVHY